MVVGYTMCDFNIGILKLLFMLSIWCHPFLREFLILFCFATKIPGDFLRIQKKSIKNHLFVLFHAYVIAADIKQDV